MRYRVADILADTRSSFFVDARTEHMTDYIAMPLRFLSGEIHAVSWTTTAPGGFSEAEIEALRALMAPVARVIEIIRLERTATALLDTYVGNRAGQRILAGQIRRGHTETMSAAIWLSDLRSFTRLSDLLPPSAVVEVLNLYFDCQVEPIAEHGGEVLKFMGDGLLAVFPIAEGGADTAEVCGRVLAAARASRERIAAMTFRHGGANFDQFRFGLALHVGEVLYGNIGGGHRLDFTCIGPAVNLAARLERIASDLNRTIVASEGFAAAAPESWLNLGEFPIAGFRRAERVYGLTDEALPPRG
jgi:adenylate cyclase